MAKVTKEVAEILLRLPEAERKKVLNAVHELAKQRIKRALEWREKLRIKAGSRLVDDASHLP